MFRTSLVTPAASLISRTQRCHWQRPGTSDRLPHLSTLAPDLHSGPGSPGWPPLFPHSLISPYFRSASPLSIRRLSCSLRPTRHRYCTLALAPVSTPCFKPSPPSTPPPVTTPFPRHTFFFRSALALSLAVVSALSSACAADSWSCAALRSALAAAAWLFAAAFESSCGLGLNMGAA